MKNVIITGLLFCVLFVNAQKNKHPYLLFTPERIEQAKKEIKTDTIRKNAWLEIKSIADQNLSKSDFSKCEYLALTYLMTNERKYAEKVKEILLQTVRTSNWSKNEEMLARIPQWKSELQMAHKSIIAANSYDAIYNTLNTNEKSEIAQGLFKLGVEPALGEWLLEPTRIHSLNSMGHNWWTSMTCMGGVLALSVKNEVPEAGEYADLLNKQMPEWFSFSGDVLQNKPKNIDAKGGMYESVNYANFGISEALLFRLSYKNACPEKQLSSIPELKNIHKFFMHVSYPNSKELVSLNFGDSHKNITGENTLILLNALGEKDPDMLWYLSQVSQGQTRDGYFYNKPMGFLYFPDTQKAKVLPELNKSELFADFGWAVLRNSWEKDATMLGVKSGYTWNHSHADANSFVLFHKGVDILKDAGNCWYPNKEYSDYFFQSQAHNVVLFNGEAQPRNQQYEGSMLNGTVSSLLDAGNIRYVLANATGPTAKNFIRNFRHFLWIDDIIYIIDDLKTYENGKFEWLWHTSGDVKKQTYDLNVVNGKSAISIRPVYPEFLAPSNFLHDYPHHQKVVEKTGPKETLDGNETYYSVQYPEKVSRVKALTAIILKDSSNQKESPWMEKMEGKDWIGLKLKYKGKVTEIYINQLADGRLMHSNSWVWANGWETDAYMFALNYDEQQPAKKDLFMAYGSALRKEGKSYFFGLSKFTGARNDIDK